MEEQHNADCLKHALNNLLFSTDRLPDDAFDGKRGLTLEVDRYNMGLTDDPVDVISMDEAEMLVELPHWQTSARADSEYQTQA